MTIADSDLRHPGSRSCTRCPWIESGLDHRDDSVKVPLCYSLQIVSTVLRRAADFSAASGGSD
jgi:hypothetical protein